MNHGYCKNCWWWDYWKSLGIKQTRFGKCYIHNGNHEPYVTTSEEGYCPDYVNRKKEEKKSGTLKDWINCSKIAEKF